MNEWMDKYTYRCMDGLTNGLMDQQSDDSFSLTRRPVCTIV